MKSPSQVIHEIHGSHAMAGCSSVDPFTCWVCGGVADRGILRWKWAGSNFVGQSKARSNASTLVCEGCVLVMGGKPPDTERMWSHFVEGQVHVRLNKGSKPAMRGFLRRPKAAPWFAAIADSGKRHVIPWTVMNFPGQSGGRVLFEEMMVELPRTEAA